jgi:hypothetical protein
MISKCVAFLVAALMLANCCASGSGCAPTASIPVAWDGLGPAPTDDALPPEPQPKQHARAKRDVSTLDAGSSERNRAQPKDEWEQEQAADQADEARLKRKLMICRDCQTTNSAHDDAASSNR